MDVRPADQVEEDGCGLERIDVPEGAVCDPVAQDPLDRLGEHAARERFVVALAVEDRIRLTLARVALQARWAATSVAAIYTAFILGVSGFLAIADVPGPALPLLVAPAVVLDLAVGRGWPSLATSALFATVLHVAYVPARNGLGNGVRFDVGDVAVGLPLTWLAVLAVLTVATRPSHRLPRRSVVAATVAALVVAAAPAALAHDPGQGEDAGDVALEVRVDEQRRAAVSALLPQSLCRGATPSALVARRAGEVVRGLLAKDGCRLQGRLTLPTPGRWFVYVELTRSGRTVESWLPVVVGSGASRASARDRYAYLPPERSGGAVKTVVGVLLYLAMLALLYGTIVLVRSAAQTRPAG